MAIAQFNPLFKPLRGKVGSLVFKHYADKVVVTRAPTFTGAWSPAQKDGRKRFALASAYARTVCADPALRAKYAALAARRGITIRSAAISACLQGKTHEIETPPSRTSCQVLRRSPPRRKTPLLNPRGRIRIIAEGRDEGARTSAKPKTKPKGSNVNVCDR